MAAAVSHHVHVVVGPDSTITISDHAVVAASDTSAAIQLLEGDVSGLFDAAAEILAPDAVVILPKALAEDGGTPASLYTLVSGGPRANPGGKSWPVVSPPTLPMTGWPRCSARFLTPTNRRTHSTIQGGRAWVILSHNEPALSVWVWSISWACPMSTGYRSAKLTRSTVSSRDQPLATASETACTHPSRLAGYREM